MNQARFTFRYRLSQLWNAWFRGTWGNKALKWVYIYGHYRGGTSYALRQTLKVSRRGCGDWMLFQFASPFLAALERQQSRAMNKRRLFRDFRRNLLKSAHVGGGFRFDIVVKQATGREEEIRFLSELFGAPPAKILFVFREPHGWWLSAKKKFGAPAEVMREDYCAAFDTFGKIGGTAVCYDESLVDRLSAAIGLKADAFDNFEPKPVGHVPEAECLQDAFDRCRREIFGGCP